MGDDLDKGLKNLWSVINAQASANAQGIAGYPKGVVVFSSAERFAVFYEPEDIGGRLGGNADAVICRTGLQLHELARAIGAEAMHVRAIRSVLRRVLLATKEAVGRSAEDLDELFHQCLVRIDEGPT